MTNLSHLTINVLKIPTVNLSSLCNSCVKMACCSSQLIFTFLYAISSIQNAGEQFSWSTHVSFVNFALNPTPQTNSNGIESAYSNICISVTMPNQTHVRMNCLSSQSPITSRSKILIFSPASPCSYKFVPCITVNTRRLYYKAQLINVVQAN